MADEPTDPTGHWEGKRPSDEHPALFFAKGDDWATWLCEQGVPGDFHTLLAAAIDDARWVDAIMRMAAQPLPPLRR